MTLKGLKSRNRTLIQKRATILTQSKKLIKSIKTDRQLLVRASSALDSLDREVKSNNSKIAKLEAKQIKEIKMKRARSKK